MYEHSDHLIKKAMPLLVAFVAFIGGSCFTVFAPDSTMDRARVLQYCAFGVLGTLGLASLIRKLWQLEPDWDFLNMRRNLIIFLLCLCWGFGAISGFILFYLIPRHIV
jgi:hypothetical protein